MKAVSIILLIFLITMTGIKIFSRLVIYELSDGYLDMRRNYYRQYMDVAEMSGKRWRAGDFNCFYEEVIWKEDDIFKAVGSVSSSESVELLLGLNEKWLRHSGAVWVKGPVRERSPSVSTWRGDVADCFSLSFGRKPKVFDTAKRSNTWHVDEKSRYIVVSNAEKTLRYLAVALRKKY